MVVYLLSSQRELKISRTKAYSNLEPIIREQINSPYWKNLENKPRIYRCDVDSCQPIKILSIKEWRQALDDFKTKFPNEIAKIELLK